jgi:hypothetical protein
MLRVGIQINGDLDMKIISTMAIASVVALSVVAFGATGAANADPIVPPGHDCIEYDEGGTDCSFTSYAQCEATASASPQNATPARFGVTSVGGGKTEMPARNNWRT